MPAHPLAVIQLENVQFPISQLVGFAVNCFHAWQTAWTVTMQVKWEETLSKTKRLTCSGGQHGDQVQRHGKKERDNYVSKDYTPKSGWGNWNTWRDNWDFLSPLHFWIVKSIRMADDIRCYLSLYLRVHHFKASRWIYSVVVPSGKHISGLEVIIYSMIPYALRLDGCLGFLFKAPWGSYYCS